MTSRTERSEGRERLVVEARRIVRRIAELLPFLNSILSSRLLRQRAEFFSSFPCVRRRSATLSTFHFGRFLSSEDERRELIDRRSERDGES